MINEPQTIFNDFVPGSFDNSKYQQRIKHKTLNELNNKIKELRKLYCYLEVQEESLDDHTLLTQLRKYFLENSLGVDRAEVKITSYSEDQTNI
jgi:hypothetical protein